MKNSDRLGLVTIIILLSIMQPARQISAQPARQTKSEFSSSLPVPVGLQQSQDPVLSPPSLAQQQQILEDTLAQQLLGADFNITDSQIIDNWARVGILEREEETVPLIATHGIIVLGLWDGAQWTLFTEGTEQFRALLPEVPDTLISATQKRLLDYINPAPDADIDSVTASGFRLPWRAGDTHYVSRAWSTGQCNHDGSNSVDVSMAIGTDIVAMKGGTVTIVVEHLTSCGCSSANDSNYVQIDHGDGTVAQYVHIGKDQAIVAVGQQVVQGQVIAHSNQIGWTCGSGTCVAGTCSVACTPGPHLHFSVLRSGVRQYISFDDVPGGSIVGCQSYTSGNTGNQCCGCSVALAAAGGPLIGGPLLGGQPIGPPAPQAQPAVVFDLTAPGEQSAMPPLAARASVADTLPPLPLDAPPTKIARPNADQFRAEAGNVLSTASAPGTADLILALPSSTNYRIIRSVFSMGGGAKSSASYLLRGTSGQAFATGPRASTSYRLNSGYWGMNSSAVTPTPTPTATATRTPTSTVTNTPTPTVTGTIVWTQTPTPTLTPTLTPPPTLAYKLFLPMIEN